jgi:hypothetical protein
MPWASARRQQRVFAAQIFDGIGTQHRQCGLRRNDPREVSCAARTGNDAGETPVRGTRRIRDRVVGKAVGRENPGFVRYVECSELIRRLLHDVPVAVAAHQYADSRRVLASCHVESSRDAADIARGLILPSRRWVTAACLVTGPGSARK